MEKRTCRRGFSLTQFFFNWWWDLNKRVKPLRSLAPVLLFLVKTPMAFIAACPDPTLLVPLFQVEVSGAVPCLGVTTLFLL